VEGVIKEVQLLNAQVAKCTNMCLSKLSVQDFEQKSRTKNDGFDKVMAKFRGLWESVQQVSVMMKEVVDTIVEGKS
jgi:hypothetical protein